MQSVVQAEMQSEIPVSEIGNDDNVNGGGGNTQNNEKGNKDATEKNDELIYVTIFQWDTNIDQGKEKEEEHQENEIVDIVPKAVVDSDGLGSVDQPHGSKETDTKNYGRITGVGIVEKCTTINGTAVDHPCPDGEFILHVRMTPVGDRLLLRDVVSCLAVMNKKLYVAFRGSPFLDVYSIEIYSGYTTFVHERVIRVKQLIDPWDLVFGINNVLYVSESYDNFIHRIQLPKEIQTRWYVNGGRMTLSVQTSGNLLVSCSADTIFEYTPTGGFVREILINRRKSALWFDRQVCGLKHAVPYVDGTFMVCMNSRVCVIDETGDIVQASEEEDQVNLPCYLAGGKDFTLVAGSYNGCIVRMNSLWQFVATDVSGYICLERPRRVIACDEGIVLVSEEGKRSITIHKFLAPHSNI